MDIPAFIEIPLTIIINTGNHRQSGRWCESPENRDDVPRTPKRPASMHEIPSNHRDLHTCFPGANNVNSPFTRRVEQSNEDAPRSLIRRASSHDAPRYPLRRESSGDAPRYPMRKSGFAVAA
jgi:hypothetical protein